MAEKKFVDHLTSKRTWIRGIFMVLFYLVNYLVRFLIVLVALFQFISMLIVGRINQPLRKFGRDLSAYAFHIYCFLTYNTEIKPYPFSDWPTDPIKELPKPSEEKPHGS